MGVGINLPRYFALIRALAGAIAVACGGGYITGGGANLMLIALTVFDPDHRWSGKHARCFGCAVMLGISRV
ncbi:MAG: hypothetical protein ACI8PT_002352 [Gammaproteobacteria bacterium]|jgi:hypothetical protein